MASIAYQSSQNNDSTSTSVAVNKPTSLAVGDLLLAHIGARTSDGVANTLTPPAGWSTSSAASNGYVSVSVFTKLANAADVAASSFTFTAAAATTTHMKGYVSRFTGVNPASPTDQAATANGSSNSPSNTGITPTSALTMFIIAVGYYSAGFGSSSVSGYAIATDNPVSWTEAYDAYTYISSGGDNAFGLALAYGSRPKPTASSTASASLAHSSSWVIAVLDLTSTPIDVLTLTTSTPTPSNRQVIPAALITTPSLPAPTATGVIPKWRNKAKNAATWVNKQKS